MLKPKKQFEKWNMNHSRIDTSSTRWCPIAQSEQSEKDEEYAFKIGIMWASPKPLQNCHLVNEVMFYSPSQQSKRVGKKLETCLYNWYHVSEPKNSLKLPSCQQGDVVQPKPTIQKIKKNWKHALKTCIMWVGQERTRNCHLVNEEMLCSPHL